MYIIYLIYIKQHQSNTFLDYINDSSVKGINIKSKKNNFNNSKQENNILSSKNENEEYRNKIKQLENRIKELEKKIEEKDKIISEEKNKNYILDNKIKEFKNFQNDIIGYKNKLKELEEEILLFRKYYNFSPEEKLISMKIISTDQQIDFRPNRL